MAASEIDAQIADYRLVQEQLQRVQNDLQLVLSQQAENEMVQQELELIENSTNVYKMVGPVLIKHSLDDAKDTVKKRLEFITGEKKRLEDKTKELDGRSASISQNVQQMQAALQKATAAAVQQVAQEAGVAS